MKTTGRQIETIQSLRDEMGLKNETPVEAFTDSAQASAEISRLLDLKHRNADAFAAKARVEAENEEIAARGAVHAAAHRAMLVKMFGEKERYTGRERRAASAALREA